MAEIGNRKGRICHGQKHPYASFPDMGQSPIVSLIP